MQILNLIWEFEMLKMKEVETIKEYANKLLGVVNKVRLLGNDFSYERIVQKNLVSVPERYESKISSLEETKRFVEHFLGRIGECIAGTRTKADDERRSVHRRCFVCESKKFRRRHQQHAK